MATSRFRSFVPILAGLLVLTAVGLAVEHRGAFPLLRLALQRSPADLPSSLIAPADAVGRGDAVLSVFVDEKDLYDRDTGILRHTTERGREWERAVTLLVSRRRGPPSRQRRRLENSRRQQPNRKGVAELSRVLPARVRRRGVRPGSDLRFREPPTATHRRSQRRSPAYPALLASDQSTGL